MPDHGHYSIVIFRAGKRLIRYWLTSAALSGMIVPVFCIAQVVNSSAADRGAGEAEGNTFADNLAVASPVSPLVSEAPPSAAAPCEVPAPLPGWQDYQGPFQKFLGTFAGKLELKSAHPPHYKPGTVLCSLEVKDKFELFVRDTFDPVSFLSAGFDAGLDQASNRDPTFGQGSEGYGRRFAADFAGQTTGRFFMDFAYPTIFAEDPRYYRLIHGSGKRRFLHAVQHTFIAQRDSGTHMLNISVWLGTATSVALNDVYHPGNERGIVPAVQAGGFSLAEGMGFDVLREFWPDIARKLRMPFRGAREP
jgi:hypothetical protein